MGAGEGPQERQANECLALKSQVGVRVREQERGCKERGDAANSPYLAWPSSVSVFVTPSTRPRCDL